MTTYRDIINPAAATVHISAGNVKTGAVPSYSTLPGDGFHYFSDGRAAVDVTGTCAGVCDACAGHCYAMRSLRYRTAARAWAENTFIQRDNPAAVFHAVTRFCNRGNVPYFRVHVSGEFETISRATGYADTFALWIAIANACPNTTFYAYTKRGDLIDEYAAIMPSNFVVQFSEWAPGEKYAEKYAPATNCAVSPTTTGRATNYAM